MTDVRVMTFNIRGSQHRDSENVWKRRAPLNVRTIERCAPDLIGFQEFQEGNLRVYETGLSGYERALGPQYENRRPYSYNAIFYNPGRLELLDTGGFWLSETPEKHSSSWDSNQVRAVNWARLRFVPDGEEFVHVNTHLDHRSAPARRAGSRLIVERFAESRANAPIVLTGDFNCNPGSRTYQIFTDAGFVDGHLAAGNGRANTFHGFKGESYEPKRAGSESRIDWILVRGGEHAGQWEVLSCDVIHDAEPPVYPSDHYPVVARLSLHV